MFVAQHAKSLNRQFKNCSRTRLRMRVSKRSIARLFVRFGGFPEQGPRSRKSPLGTPDVFLDSYAAASSASLWAAIVFHPSDFLIFSSRYHTMYSLRARTKHPFVVPFQSRA